VEPAQKCFEFLVRFLAPMSPPGRIRMLAAASFRLSMAKSGVSLSPAMLEIGDLEKPAVITSNFPDLLISHKA
jgi:hypothetical protein